MANVITIPNIHEFTQQVINGSLVLTRINPIITEAELFQKNLRGSIITECKINNVVVNVKKFRKLLIHLYSTTDMHIILQNTILNIVALEKYDKGFEYYADLGLSIQGADSRRTLREIINILRLKGWTMDLQITLAATDIIRVLV